MNRDRDGNRYLVLRHTAIHFTLPIEPSLQAFHLVHKDTPMLSPALVEILHTPDRRFVKYTVPAVI